MEASFPYEETIDQLRATAEVKADMERTVPMDRLVVGDVGYGKTEQLRGAFKATQDGKQGRGARPDDGARGAAPRHVQPAFAAFPIEVRLLSRFVSAKEQAATLAGLADGSVDVVIGTHRLLSKDVRFKDLGLVVVDEEQRFGVAAKERLKQASSRGRRPDAIGDPVPARSTAMAGIRDLSVVRAPRGSPADPDAPTPRPRPDWSAMRSCASSTVAARCPGQVETIEAPAERSGGCCCPVRGRPRAMPEGALEKVMIAFAAGDANVLVSTTIIRSGLDIPNANTIAIDRADTLGLAQLYQLRGLVSRSSRRAYAYLLYRRRERLSDEARKRLQAIFNASELGAGFQIALSDLEIRGAGNILGAEQSGHMAAVGFDLYSRMLARRSRRRRPRARARARRRRRRRSSTCRSMRTCPTTTCLTRRKSSSCTGGWHVPDGGRHRRVPAGGHGPVRADACHRSPPGEVAELRVAAEVASACRRSRARRSAGRALSRPHALRPCGPRRQGTARRPGRPT